MTFALYYTLRLPRDKTVKSMTLTALRSCIPGMHAPKKLAWMLCSFGKNVGQMHKFNVTVKSKWSGA